MGPALPCRERDAGGAGDLVGPHQTLSVSGEKELGAGRVQPRQLFAKTDAAQHSMQLKGLLSDRLGNFGDRRQSVL